MQRIFGFFYLGSLSAVLAAMVLNCWTAEAAWKVKERIQLGEPPQILAVENVETKDDAPESANAVSQPRVLREIESSIEETYFGEPAVHQQVPALYRETLYPGENPPDFAVKFLQSAPLDEGILFAESEVRTLVDQGPASNRINLTLVGDGYTLEERAKFFADAERMTQDLFIGKTFQSYLPLFNVYAVFVASKDSGITDAVEKDTVLGLYRTPKGSKRAIMVGKPSAARQALRLAPATDYSILIANDDYYGGLGGEFAITTRSPESGTLVLRHELGHNFGNVGEEYDGGQVYRGANYSRTKTVPWAQWVVGTQTPVHEAKLLNGEYVWENLSNGPITIDFDFPGPTEKGPFRLATQISAVGWSTPEDVSVTVDGVPVELSGIFTADRTFLSLNLESNLTAGRHRLRFEEKIKDGDNVLAFAQLYALPAGYDVRDGVVGAFLNHYEPGSQAGYRPTHGSCLMREMRLTSFCAVDQENMWLRFLSKVSLVDEVKVGPSPVEPEDREVTVATPRLRDLKIRWFVKKNGTWNARPDLVDQTVWFAKPEDRGSWKVDVEFQTPEIRKSSPTLKVTRELQVQ